MLIQVDGRLGSRQSAVESSWPQDMGGFENQPKGVKDSWVMGRTAVVVVVWCGVGCCGSPIIVVATAATALGCKGFSHKQNAFDINTSVHSFHLVCFVIIIGILADPCQVLGCCLH